MNTVNFHEKLRGTQFVNRHSAAQKPQASRALRTELVAAKFSDIRHCQLPIAECPFQISNWQ
jgi:hypothetical protein